MLAASAVAVFSATAVPIAIATLFSFAYLLVRRKHALWHQKTASRYAHQLTLLRLLILCFAAWQLAEIQPLVLLLLFAANVGLDVVDGFIARRFDQVTAFGMVFDREVDAIYVLVACLYFYLEAAIPAWILVPGLLPYLYRLVAWALGNPPIAGKKQQYAAFLAGVNFVLILVAVALSGDARFVVLVISTAIVTISFMASFVDLARFRNDSEAV